MSAQRGSALMDAMAAAIVTGLALAVLVYAGHVTATTLALTADTAGLLDVAGTQLEHLRRWPAADGSATVHHLDGRTYQLAWSSLDGRGLPRQITVTATSAQRTLTVSSQAFP